MDQHAWINMPFACFVIANSLLKHPQYAGNAGEQVELTNGFKSLSEVAFAHVMGDHHNLRHLVAQANLHHRF